MFSAGLGSSPADFRRAMGGPRRGRGRKIDREWGKRVNQRGDVIQESREERASLRRPLWATKPGELVHCEGEAMV